MKKLHVSSSAEPSHLQQEIDELKAQLLAVQVPSPPPPPQQFAEKNSSPDMSTLLSTIEELKMTVRNLQQGKQCSTEKYYAQSPSKSR